ncbi:hypothetical protein [Salinimicrobium flavum]|uniref:Uncharacterized protein n=1 Tax=Salinimicrobium flavum TaxID=1737065 RepID=A0ABW5IS96_9FLAO
MEVEEKSNKRKYGRMGCLVAVLVVVIILILMALGIIGNSDWANL